MLMEIVETTFEGSLAASTLSVPSILWRIANQKGSQSLLLHGEPCRSPGAAFVEADGADGVLAQAMLSLVFRMLRFTGSRESCGRPARVDTRSDDTHEHRTKGLGGCGEGHGGGAQPHAKRAWTTAAEALSETAIASGDEEGSCFGFGGRLVGLFADQDDALINMLLTNLYIFRNFRSAVSVS